MLLVGGQSVRIAEYQSFDLGSAPRLTFGQNSELSEYGAGLIGNDPAQPKCLHERIAHAVGIVGMEIQIGGQNRPAGSRRR